MLCDFVGSGDDDEAGQNKGRTEEPDGYHVGKVDSLLPHIDPVLCVLDAISLSWLPCRKPVWLPL